MVVVVDGGSGGSPGADVDGEEDCEQRPELELGAEAGAVEGVSGAIVGRSKSC